MNSSSSPTPIKRIELDLDPRALPSRRTAPSSANQNPHFESPKIYPVIGPSMLGSDQTQRTVAVLILLSAVSAIISTATNHGNFIDLIAIPACLIFGILMFRGSDFIRKLYLYLSILQLGTCIVFFILTMGAGPIVAVFMLFNIFSIIGMIYLLSGDAISRGKYIFCVASILIVKVITAIGSLTR